MNETSKQLTRDLNTGLTEGLIITFAVIAGLRGAEQERVTIIYTALTASILGALAFAISRYATEKTAFHEFHFPENPGAIHPHKKKMFRELGLAPDIQETALSEMAKDQEQWASSIQRSAAKPDSHLSHAFYAAAAIALSYFAGGILTLVPLVVGETLRQSLGLSAALYAGGLLISGFWRGSFLKRNKLAGALIRLAIGVAAAASAFFVGRLMS